MRQTIDTRERGRRRAPEKMMTFPSFTARERKSRAFNVMSVSVCHMNEFTAMISLRFQLFESNLNFPKKREKSTSTSSRGRKSGKSKAKSVGFSPNSGGLNDKLHSAILIGY